MPAVRFLLAVKLSNVAVVSVIPVLVSFTVVPSFTVTVYDVTAPLEGAVQETVSEFTVAAVTWRSAGAFGSLQTHHIYMELMKINLEVLTNQYVYKQMGELWMDVMK